MSAGDDDLRDEVEAMFADEQRKHRYEARKTWNIPPGYYDDKTDFYSWWSFLDIGHKKRKKK